MKKKIFTLFECKKYKKLVMKNWQRQNIIHSTVIHTKWTKKKQFFFFLWKKKEKTKKKKEVPKHTYLYITTAYFLVSLIQWKPFDRPFSSDLIFWRENTCSCTKQEAVYTESMTTFKSNTLNMYAYLFHCWSLSINFPVGSILISVHFSGYNVIPFIWIVSTRCDYTWINK